MRKVVTLYEDDILHLQIENHNELPFLHCEVKEWSKEKYFQILEIWESAKDDLKQQGIDFLFCWALDEKTTRFAQMFGFTEVITDQANQSLLFVRY